MLLAHKIDKELSFDTFTDVCGTVEFSVLVASPYAMNRGRHEVVPDVRLGKVSWDVLHHNRVWIIVDW